MAKDGPGKRKSGDRPHRVPLDLNRKREAIEYTRQRELELKLLGDTANKLYRGSVDEAADVKAVLYVALQAVNHMREDGESRPLDAEIFLSIDVEAVLRKRGITLDVPIAEYMRYLRQILDPDAPDDEQVSFDRLTETARATLEGLLELFSKNQQVGDGQQLEARARSVALAVAQFLVIAGLGILAAAIEALAAQEPDVAGDMTKVAVGYLLTPVGLRVARFTRTLWGPTDFSAFVKPGHKAVCENAGGLVSRLRAAADGQVNPDTCVPFAYQIVGDAYAAQRMIEDVTWEMKGAYAADCERVRQAALQLVSELRPDPDAARATARVFGERIERMHTALAQYRFPDTLPPTPEFGSH